MKLITVDRNSTNKSSYMFLLLNEKNFAKIINLLNICLENIPPMNKDLKRIIIFMHYI
jgi:hypothetical protein